MGTSCYYPGFSCQGKIRQGLPKGPRDRKVGHVLADLKGYDLVNHQSESISQVYQRCIDGWSGITFKNQSYRIIFATYPQWMYLTPRLR